MSIESTLAIVPAVPATPATAPSGFPFRSTLSLEPLIAYWQEREQAANAGVALLARAIGEQVAENPWCRGPLND